MDIRKLTITPIISSRKDIIINKPTAERAGMLIKERLSTGTYMPGDKMPLPRPLRKLPEALKGFVNPNTRVITPSTFSINS